MTNESLHITVKPCKSQAYSSAECILIDNLENLTITDSYFRIPCNIWANLVGQTCNQVQVVSITMAYKARRARRDVWNLVRDFHAFIANRNIDSNVVCSDISD